MKKSFLKTKQEKDSVLNSDSYRIYPFFIRDLKLKGIDLQNYAILYQKKRCTLKYIEVFSSKSRKSVIRSCKRLKERQLIEYNGTEAWLKN